MKQRFLHIVLSLAMIACIACNGGTKEETANMTDAQILEVLDIKIHRNPKDAQLYFERAKVLMRMDRMNDAINNLLKATELDDDEVEYYMLLGDAYFANGDIEHSYSTIQRAIELDDKNSEAYLKLGEIAFYGRDYDRAMDNLSKVTATDKNNRTALFMKSFIYKETGDTSNAVVLMRKVCDLYPEYEPAFEELGTLYAEKLNPMAVEYLNTALKLEPQNTNALYCLAMYYQNKNDMDMAEELYKKILDIDAGHKNAWHNRGYIECFHYGDYDKAIEYYSKAIQCDNRFIEAHVNRGCAYELKGDKANAEICFRTAVEIDPSFTPANEGLKRLGKK